MKNLKIIRIVKTAESSLIVPSKVAKNHASLKTFLCCAISMIILQLSTESLAQTEGSRNGFWEDGFVINSDNTNHWSFLRLQTYNDEAWNIRNQNGLNWNYSKSGYHGDIGFTKMSLSPDGDFTIFRRKIGFSSPTDWNHSIYNNYHNIDGEGAWDGMKFNVFDGASFRVGNANGVVPTTALHIDNLGNVGIGTTSPTKKLEVNGNARIHQNLAVGHGWGGTAGPGVNIGKPDGSGAWQAGSAYLQFKDSQVNGTNKGTSIAFFSHTYGGGTNEAMRIAANGHVGIGTTDPGSYKLAIEGKIGARGIDVKAGSWADFVFEESYELNSLTEVDHYIQTHGHLPGIPSGQEVLEQGIDVSEMFTLQMQKIEELTLYVIELEEKVSQLSAKTK